MPHWSICDHAAFSDGKRRSLALHSSSIPNQMIRTFPLVGFLLFAAVSSGCGSNPLNPIEIEKKTDQNDTPEGLDLYRARWSESGITDYRLGVFQRCVCVQNLILYDVVVENGVPISATKTSSQVENEPVPVEDVPYPTIESLFELVEFGFETQADSVGVLYRTDNGRPQQITIDFVRNVADDEINAYVESFQETN